MADACTSPQHTARSMPVSGQPVTTAGVLAVQEQGSSLALANAASLELCAEASCVASVLQRNEAALQAAVMESTKLRQLLDGERRAGRPRLPHPPRCRRGTLMHVHVVSAAVIVGSSAS
jgi:hypothetical protein